MKSPLRRGFRRSEAFIKHVLRKALQPLPPYEDSRHRAPGIAAAIIVPGSKQRHSLEQQPAVHGSWLGHRRWRSWRYNLFVMAVHPLEKFTAEQLIQALRLAGRKGSSARTGAADLRSRVAPMRQGGLPVKGG